LVTKLAWRFPDRYDASYAVEVQRAHRGRFAIIKPVDRCLWGTDWTRSFAVVNYEQAIKPFLETDRLSDTEWAMLMGGACAKAYNWSPQKG
jgi:hypothetical protein